MAIADVAALPLLEGDVNTALPCRRLSSSQPGPATCGGAAPGSCGGSYHTDRAPVARQLTAKCPQMAWSSRSSTSATSAESATPPADHAAAPGPGTVRLLLGGSEGARALPLITYRVAPGQTKPVPLLTGTASFTPRLGYTVLPGPGGIQATLTLRPDPRNSSDRRTPVLPLTITA